MVGTARAAETQRLTLDAVRLIDEGATSCGRPKTPRDRRRRDESSTGDGTTRLRTTWLPPSLRDGSARDEPLGGEAEMAGPGRAMRCGVLLIAVLAGALGCGARSGFDFLGAVPESRDAGLIVPTVADSSSSSAGQECPGGESMCSARCVDLQNDPNDCGECGTTCPMGASCQLGKCACATGEVCAGGCIDEQMDPNNCGGCGRKCAAGESCLSGTCSCPGQETLCPGACVDEQGDANNCGGCGKRCTGAAPFCSNGACVAPPTSPSCQRGGQGMSDCGPSRTESCCTSDEVVGGTFFRTYDPNGPGAGGAPIGQANPATVSSFRLDKYVVTVGRFRQFVRAWTGGYSPPAGSGKHTHLNGGAGLNAAGGGYEPGWVVSDSSSVAPTNDNLAGQRCDGTWTSSANGQESLPISCVNWFEAYAFCIWDGGFLPSEAEWEYAAAGGSEQREYPWGSTAPGLNNQYAIESCQYPTGSTSCTNSLPNLPPVGTATLGAGRWGQLDLEGEIWEWNVDWWKDYVEPWTDSAALTVLGGRILRGGDAWDGPDPIDTQQRTDGTPTGRWHNIGFRCARIP